MITDYIDFLHFLKENGYIIDYVEKHHNGWDELKEERDYYKLALGYINDMQRM